MKKSLLVIALLLGIFYNGRAQVIITEIMYNPPESGNDSLEYIELYNLSNLSVDVSGWTFNPTGIDYVFPAGTSMAPGSFVVLAKSASAFQGIFGFAPTVWTAGALSNNGELLELRDAAGNVIDNVTYGNAVPWPAEGAGMGPSIVLCDFNSDNSLPANWQAASTGTGKIINNFEVKGNPGAISGCTGSNQITAVNDNVAAPSGQTTIFNVQANDLIINPLTSFMIITAPTQGSATVSGNSISYQSNAGYCGPDQFTYQICDANNCSEATVSINVKCYPVRTIGIMSTENASGVADSLNATCELQGTVYGVNLRPINSNQPALLFTIIDGAGNGIAVSSLGGTYGYTVNEKDKVTVRGTIQQFNGQTEIRPDTILKVSANNPLLAPTVVTTLSEATESKLVKINNVHFVDIAEWTTGMGASGFNVRVVSDNNLLDTLLLRIDHDVENYNAVPVNAPFDLTGIGGQFDATSPFTEGYQILPRFNSDIDYMVGTHQVDFSNEVSLAPNPVSNILSIEMNTAFDRIMLLNTLGQEMKTYFNPAFNQKVDVSLYKAGVYFVRFEKDGKTWSTRFVKQ